MPWDPERYHQFEAERAAPFADLLALVRVRPGLRVVDLGCGTGELTRRLADALPESDVLGVDSSPAMLERAAAYVRAGLRFELGAIETFAGGAAGYDLIFSHAALQWVEDHASLIPRLFARLESGGQLAVQVPSNHNHPSHTLILELADQEPFRSALGGWRRIPPVLTIDQYAELLFAHGALEITAYEKVYPHVLADADAMADWMSGTALVPYFERLGPELKEDFLAAYRERLGSLWPERPVFYPFRRTLFAARRA
jgi:trans-aconitate 2-methyltransferase